MPGSDDFVLKTVSERIHECGVRKRWQIRTVKAFASSWDRIEADSAETRETESQKRGRTQRYQRCQRQAVFRRCRTWSTVPYIMVDSTVTAIRYPNHSCRTPIHGAKVCSYARWMPLQSSRITELHSRITRSRVAIDRVQGEYPLLCRNNSDWGEGGMKLRTVVRT